MRVVAQRCLSASVHVAGRLVAAIDRGLCCFVAAGVADGPADVRYIAAKLAGLRVFARPEGGRRMDLSLRDVGGSLLVVPQFTLYGDVRRGLRPDFHAAAAPALGRTLLSDLASVLRALDVPTAEGEFGADMRVLVENDGPVTIWMESPSGGD